MINDYDLVKYLSTDDGLMRIKKWLVSNGISSSDIEISTNRTFPSNTISSILIPRYSKINDVDYITGNGKMQVVNIDVSDSQCHIRVSEFYRYEFNRSEPRKKTNICTLGTPKIGDLLSSTNSRPYHRNYPNQYEYDKFSELLDRSFFYSRKERLDIKLIEYIHEIPSILRDEKISTIIDE